MLDWFNDRISLWETHALAVGLLPASVTAFKEELDAAIAQRSDTILKRNAAKAATTKLNDLAEAARTTGAGLVQTIKAFAATTGDPDVFELSQVPQAKPPAPLPPPEAPTMLDAAVRAGDGATILRWDASIAGGVNFTIHRSVDMGAGATEPVLVGTVGGREFVDLEVPACTHLATYYVVAWRGGKSSGFSTPFSIRYTAAGGEGAGLMAEAA